MLRKTDGHYRNRFIENNTKPMNTKVRRRSPLYISEGKDELLLCWRLSGNYFQTEHIVYFSIYLNLYPSVIL